MVTVSEKGPDTTFPKGPGFLTRLSNLIIVQGLFVFAALALILFWPGGDRSSRSIETEAQGLISSLGTRMTDLSHLDSSSADLNTTRVMTGIDESRTVRAAGLFTFGPDSSVICIARFNGDPKDTGSLSNNITSEADFELVRLAMDCRPGFMLSSIYNPTSTIYYYRLNDHRGLPVVFSGIIGHQLYVSAVPETQHALFVLFMVSTLLSLLTVHLISRRFKRPLERLQRGLDKTADGDRYYMIEPHGDEELRSLSQSFNRMTEILWSNRLKLNAYNERLSRISVSLLEAQQFLATLIDSSPDAIVVTSPEGEVAIFNRQADSQFGYSGEEAVGREITALFARQQNRVSLETIAERPECSFETICLRKDGKRFPAFVVHKALRDDSGQVRARIYMIRDISESRSFQEMMIRLDRYYTRGEMAGDIAHEINNYLAILSGNLELLPILLKKNDPEKLNKKLDLMRGTVEKIARFSDGLMDKGREELSFESADLNQTVENVIAFLKPQNKFDSVSITTELSAEIPSVQIDVGQIQQVLVNLINNAAEALSGQQGEKSILVTTRLSDSDPNCVSVLVTDNGPGVLKEKEELLFSRRFTTKRKGHGIGLITCQRIIAAHHGSINYRFCQGATFEIEIPIKRPVTSEVHSAVPDTVTSAL